MSERTFSTPTQNLIPQGTNCLSLQRIPSSELFRVSRPPNGRPFTQKLGKLSSDNATGLKNHIMYALAFRRAFCALFAIAFTHSYSTVPIVSSFSLSPLFQNSSSRPQPSQPSTHQARTRMPANRRPRGLISLLRRSSVRSLCLLLVDRVVTERETQTHPHTHTHIHRDLATAQKGAFSPRDQPLPSTQPPQERASERCPAMRRQGRTSIRRSWSPRSSCATPLPSVPPPPATLPWLRASRD